MPERYMTKSDWFPHSVYAYTYFILPGCGRKTNEKKKEREIPARIGSYSLGYARILIELRD
jgi:hypothetical protein